MAALRLENHSNVKSTGPQVSGLESWSTELKRDKHRSYFCKCRYFQKVVNYTLCFMVASRGWLVSSWLYMSRDVICWQSSPARSPASVVLELVVVLEMLKTLALMSAYKVWNPYLCLSAEAFLYSPWVFNTCVGCQWWISIPPFSHFYNVSECVGPYTVTCHQSWALCFGQQCVCDLFFIFMLFLIGNCFCLEKGLIVLSISLSKKHVTMHQNVDIYIYIYMIL